MKSTATMIILAARFGPEARHCYENRLGSLIGTAPAASNPGAVQIAYEEASAMDKWEKEQEPV